MAEYLFVPVTMDALCLSDGGAVLDAYEAFNQLPRVDADGDHNEGSPYLSTTIDSTAFNDQNLFLPAGVHLHWALPPALARGRARQGNSDVEFVPAPNRWLVVRSVSSDGKNWTVSAVNLPSEAAGSETGMWIIESDFIATDRSGEQRFDSHFVTYPVPSLWDGVGNKNLRPDRFLGRVSTLSAAGFTQQTADHYLPSIAGKLTAIGYGEPAFAAFYPNCIGVFGMHDPHPLHPANTRYDLFGWYSEPAVDDPFPATIRDFTATSNPNLRNLANHYAVDAKRKLIPEDPSNKPLLPDDFAFAFLRWIEEDMQWQLEASEFSLDPAAKSVRAANSPVSGIICYSRLSLKGNHSFDEFPKMTLPVGIGKTGSEALAAVLADEIAPKQAAQLEDLLESLSLSKDLAASNLDARARFEQARHAKGFRPVTGESIWTVRPANSTSSADTSVTLPDDLAESLNLLNSLQKAYDQFTFRIESRQQNLFSAFVRFMELSYPDNPEFLDNFSDDGMIAASAALIDRQEVAILALAKAARGTVDFALDGHGNWTATATISAAGQQNASVASRLKAQLDVVQAALLALNKERANNKQAALLLSRSDGPRFYDAAEPVVLFFGDPRFRPSARYDQAPTHPHVRKLSLFQPAQLSVKAAVELVDQLDQIRALTGDGFKEAKDTDTDDQRRPWNPFLLEWEALVATNPLARPAGQMNNRGLGAFFPQYIRSNQGRRDSLLKLTPPPEETAAISQLFRPVRGRTVLSTHPLIQLNELLDDFKPSALADSRTQQVNSLLDQVRQKLSNDFHCLAQSLGGFNRALLMQRAAYQLPIGDPISMSNPAAFQAYAQFISKVRTALTDAPALNSPEPNYGFFPIQGGNAFLKRLRIVDTFGQVLEWDDPRLIRSSTLGGGGHSDHIILSPRITQPARLSFRWLSAANDAIESNDHPASTPVCGWIIPNHIDNSFDVYNTDGVIQGVVDSSGRFRMPPGQVNGPVRAEDLANPHLIALVRFLTGDAKRLQTFTNNLNQAIEQIDPESFAQHRARALLVGRPMALVRARVDLELRGLPANDQSWIDLRLRLAFPNRRPNDRDFLTVKFPIRIGDHKRFNDGVATYWLEQGPDLGDPIFAFDPTDDKSILWHSIQDPGMTVSLLIDPRAPVTASCGVLPSKSITVPADQFAAALQNMEIDFLIAPILTEPDKTLLPLPSDPDLTWTWLQRDGSSWTTIPETPLLFRETILSAFPSQGEDIWNQLIVDLWIRPLDDRPDRAILLRQPAEGPLPLNGFDAAAVTRVISANTRTIAPIEIHGRFGPSLEIREGYLRLNQEFTS